MARRRAAGFRGRGAVRGAPTARQIATAKARAAARAERRAIAAERRAARYAREIEMLESVRDAGGDDDIEVDQQGPGVEPMAPPPRPLTIDDLMLGMAQMQQQMLDQMQIHMQAQQVPPPQPQPPLPPPPTVRGSAAIITDFIKLHPPVFVGAGDPMVAERWLDQVIKCIETLGIQDDATFIRLATFQFRDAAETWWRSVRDSKGIVGMTRTVFQELFLEQYFPQVIRDDKRKEFMDLIQGTNTVAEYEVQFTALSRFATEMVSTAHLKCRRFEAGLSLSFRTSIVIQRHSDYASLVASAMVAEKDRISTSRITDRNRQMRAGAASTSHQQQGLRRTRDDVGSYGDVQQFGTPQSSVTVPAQSEQRQRKDIVCYGCGRTGHVQSLCRFASGSTSRDTSTITCYQCGQLGHTKRQCPQLQRQTQSVAGSTARSGVSVTQPALYQPALDSHRGYQPAASLPPTVPSTSAQASRVGTVATPTGGQQGSGLRQGRVYAATAHLMTPAARGAAGSLP